MSTGSMQAVAKDGGHLCCKAQTDKRNPVLAHSESRTANACGLTETCQDGIRCSSDVLEQKI